MAKEGMGSAGNRKAQEERKPKGKTGNVLAKGTARKGGTDNRFAAMHTDPRFKRFPKKANKVEIDSRFAGMFTEERFQVRGAVDKRGRKVKTSKSKEDMRRYYRLAAEEEQAELETQRQGDDGGQEEEAAPLTEDGERRVEGKPMGHTSGGAAGESDADSSEDSDDDKGSDEAADASSSEEEEEDDEEDRARKLYLRARGLVDASSSSDEEQDVAESEDNSDVEKDFNQLMSSDEEAEAEIKQMEKEFGVGALAALDPEVQKVEMVEDATRRLAIVDLDWNHVKAADILAMLRSFCGGGIKGRVERVTVYPSDYGLERMKAETVAGPQAIFQRGESFANSDDDSDDSDGEDVDKKRLRYYERSRLRYFYAVAEMDSAETANRIYVECDGLEFEHSACRLDLRFVPDSLDLSDRQVRDTADSVPVDYEAPVFQTKALMHSNVQLTWDTDDNSRKKILQKAVTDDELKDDDIAAFLGSDDSEDEEADADQLRDRYRSLLGLGEASSGSKRAGAKDWAAAKNQADSEDEEGSDDENEADQGNGAFRTEDKDRAMEMEVTFTPSLDGLADRLKARKADKGKEGDETVWEAYLRKKKQNKLQKKMNRQKQVESDDEGDEDAVDSDLDDGLYATGGEGSTDPFFEHPDDPFSDPFFNSSPVDPIDDTSADKAARKWKKDKVKKLKKARETEPESGGVDKADLEMLLMDDSEILAATRGVQPSEAPDRGAEEDTGRTKRVSRKERIKRKKEARMKARRDDSDDEAPGSRAALEGFKADLQDKRFQALFTNPMFAIDPTDPEFKRHAGNEQMAKDVAQLRSQFRATGATTSEASMPASSAKTPGLGGTEENSMKAMVANLKRKANKMDSTRGNVGFSSISEAAEKKKKKKKTKKKPGKDASSSEAPGMEAAEKKRKNWKRQ